MGMFLVSLCQIKPISSLYSRCVKYALSLAMLSVHHRQKKPKNALSGCVTIKFSAPPDSAYYNYFRYAFSHRQVHS